MKFWEDNETLTFQNYVNMSLLENKFSFMSKKFIMEGNFILRQLMKKYNK